MADPTVSAYNRILPRGQTRPHRPSSLALGPVADIVADPQYTRSFDAWATVRDCYDGETTIKDASEQYLPKLSAHGVTEYDTYKGRAYFYNAVRRTHRGLMGSLFRKPPEFTLPSGLASRLNLARIGIDGSSIHTFVRQMAHEVLLTGRFGILVDFKNDKWQSPYLASYLAENIYAWRKTTYGDREVVDRIVLLENESVHTDYGYSSTLLVRILRLDPDPDRPGELVYSQTEIRPDGADAEDALRPVVRHVSISARAGRPLRYIPFVFVNSVDLRTDVGVVPLEDIARINISHYQSTAHLEHGRFYAGMPTYYIAGDSSGAQSGIPDGMMNPNPLSVGPSFVWDLEAGAKAGLLEFTGHGLTFLENAVDSKQLQMQSLGGRLISSTRRAAAMSDEAWQLLETGDEATLMDIALTMDEAMTRALTYVGDIMGEIADLEKSGILAEFNKEFVRSDLTARELRALQALAERGHIPTDVMYYALREVGVVPIEYSLDEFKALLSKQEQIWKPPVDPNAPPVTSGVGQPGVRNRAPAPPVNKDDSSGSD